MNKTQKIILSLLIPIVIGTIAIGLAYNISYRPFKNIDETWWVWTIAVIATTVIEYTINSNKS